MERIKTSKICLGCGLDIKRNIKQFEICKGCWENSYERMFNRAELKEVEDYIEKMLIAEKFLEAEERVKNGKKR